MAVAIDNSQIAFGTTGTTLDRTITVAVNNDRVLVALVGSANVPLLTVNSVTGGGGGAWASLGVLSDATGVFRWEIWTSIAPATGAQTVQATYSGTVTTDSYLAVYSLYGANQTTPANNFASDGVTGDKTLNVTGDADGVQLFAASSNVSPDPITSGTEDQTGFGGFAQVRTAHQTASPTATFTYTNGCRGLVGCNVKAAAAAGTQLMGQSWM